MWCCCHGEDSAGSVWRVQPWVQLARECWEVPGVPRRPEQTFAWLVWINVALVHLAGNQGFLLKPFWGVRQPRDDQDRSRRGVGHLSEPISGLYLHTAYKLGFIVSQS